MTISPWMMMKEAVARLSLGLDPGMEGQGRVLGLVLCFLASCLCAAQYSTLSLWWGEVGGRVGRGGG